MNLARARNILVATFLAGFAVQTLAVGVMWMRGAMYGDQLTRVLTSLLTVYSVPLGVIVGGVFAQETRRPNQRHAVLAVALAGIWNLLLVARTLSVGPGGGGTDPIVELTDYWSSVSSGGAFLIGGVLAYFFASQER